MQTKNLVIGGVLALALLLGTGAGTAKAVDPDGSDSQEALNLIVQLVGEAQNAVASASSSGSEAEIVAAFDVLIVAQLTAAFFELYFDAFFNGSSGPYFFGDDFDFTVGTNLALSGLAETLSGTSNPFAESILSISETLNSTLTSAVENDD